MKTNTTCHPKGIGFRHLAIACALGISGAWAQVIIEVGGDGVIGSETLAGNSFVTNGATFTAAGDAGFVYSGLVSPPVTVGTTGEVILTFDHTYFIEAGWDGGAVFVRVDGGPATYLPIGAFSAEPYDGNTLANTPDTAWEGGENVFYGKSGVDPADPDYAILDPVQVTSVASLGTLNAGATVSVEFRGGWDGGYNEPGTDWEISAVKITDGGATDILDVDFVADGRAGFTVSNIGGIGNPWTYLAPRYIFELDANADSSDSYAPVAPGNAINLEGADLVVEILSGSPAIGDSFALFDLSGGSTLTGNYHSITLPGGTEWDVSGLQPGGDGTITLLRYTGFKLLQRDLTGGSDGNPNSATEALAILALAAPDAQYNYTDTQVVRNTINVADGGSFGGTGPLPSGAANADTYVLRATTNLVIPAGDWTIGFGSDDGGSLTIPGITFLGKVNSTGAANEVRFEGTRGHAWTFGTFTLTEPLATTLDAMMFESSGGDSWEIAIFEGHTATFDANTWVLLQDGAKGWSIEWADTVAPTVADTHPVDGFAAAAVVGKLSVTFSENIALTGAGTITIDNLDGGADITINLPDSRVTASGNTVFIDPGANLAFATNYAVLISADAIEDLPDPAPNAFAGILNTTAWNFTTVIEDATAPVIGTFVPDGTGILPTGSLVATFDENIILGEALVNTLLDENFDTDDGGFTPTGTPDDWQRGTPNSNNSFGLVINADNSGSGQCWATVLGTGGTPPFGGATVGTASVLRSPSTAGNGIDLTALGSAQLQFAAAVDAADGDTVEVRVREVGSGDLLATILPFGNSPLAEMTSKDWATYGPYDISAAVGSEVYLEFAYTCTQAGYLGLYIDDVKVTGVDTTTAITIVNTDTNATMVIPIGDASQVSVSGNVLTITPAVSLDPAADYAVRIGPNAIRNYSGLYFAGISDTTTWAFSTLDVTTITGTAAGPGGATDTWNNPANWDTNTVPVAGKMAIVANGVTASVQNAATPAYSGGLILNTGSILDVRNTAGSENAIGTGLITFKQGSTLRLRCGYNLTIPANMNLAGNAVITNADNSTDNKTREISGDISGTGSITYEMRRGNRLILSGDNSAWSGGITVSLTDFGNLTNFSFFRPLANGCGTGNVTVNDGVTLEIVSGLAAGTIDDAASLYLNGRGRHDKGKIDLLANETVGRLFIDGTQYPAGTYSASGATDFLFPSWISGAGVLTVVNGPSDAVAPTVTSIGDNKSGGQMFVNSSVTYTVNFSEPILGSTVNVGDFSTVGTAAATVDSVTQVALGVYRVVVSVTSTGTVQLQINAGATFEDFARNPLDTSSPIPDDSVITVIPFVSNNATLVAEFQATVASEQHPTYAGEARYFHVSVNPNNAGTGSYAATIVGTNNPAPVFVRNYTGPVVAYKFLGGTDNSISGIAAQGGETGRITYATKDTVFDGFGQQQAKIWDATDPGSDLATGGADPYNVSTNNKNGGGYRSFGGAVGTIDISGLPSGSVHIYYGAFSAKPSVRVSLRDSSGLHPDVTLANVHLNNDNADRTEYYLAEVDFVTDGIYDLIEYEWLANSVDYSGNGRGLGTVLTGPDVAATPYATWAETNAPSGGPDDDFDGDGVSNAVEFVLGGDKDTNDLGKLPAVDITPGGDMTFTFVRDQDSIDDSVTLTIEVSTDLATWPTSYAVPDADTGGVVNPGVTVVSGAGTDTVTLTVPKGSDPKKFARLKVVITQ